MDAPTALITIKCKNATIGTCCSFILHFWPFQGGSPNVPYFIYVSLSCFFLWFTFFYWSRWTVSVCWMLLVVYVLISIHTFIIRHIVQAHNKPHVLCRFYVPSDLNDSLLKLYCKVKPRTLENKERVLLSPLLTDINSELVAFGVFSNLAKLRGFYQ